MVADDALCPWLVLQHKPMNKLTKNSPTPLFLKAW